MKPFDPPINVSQPFLPPLSSYANGLQEIWDNLWLTNRGPVLGRFEKALMAHLAAPQLSLFTNGSLALQIALQGLGLTGEVITTPFTFVATGNALMQNGLTPVFADIEPTHLAIDPARVEALITPRTSAILAVHVFGYPCAVEALEEVARRRGLKLIYDGAHAFGVTIAGEPISRWGDVTMFSFHATKPFHSIEGGALVFRDPDLKRRFDMLCNHGIDEDGDVPMFGTNAKMSEFQALMGTLMLDHVAEARSHGREIETAYRHRLAELPGLAFLPEAASGVVQNHAFMPILVDPVAFGMSRDRLAERLAAYNVRARRYFYPLISDMAGYRHLEAGDPLSEARKVGQRILALPTYSRLAITDVHRICDLIIAIYQGRDQYHA